MAEKRESNRVKDSNQRRILDEASRRRRQRKVLDSLEQDNFQDDPHANLVMHKKAPKFEETLDQRKNKKKLKGEPFKQRFRKNFAALLEEEQLSCKEPPNYLSASVSPSNLPPRHFCNVCGFSSTYTCISCGAKYCSIRCLKTHQDTRCLKWTA